MSQIADRAGNSDGTGGSSPARSTRVRRNCPWTEAEHRLFLLGLEKYGRGSWRNIAAEFVTTRTATQVASHAQKYFLRDSAANQIRKRQRPSIHDIRSSSSVPSTQLEQEQLKCSLQRINKQSMELEMNAASDFHGGAAFGYPPGAQSGLNAASVEDPSQNAPLQGHNPLAQDRGPAQSFWPPGQSESQILAQNVLRGLLNSPFQLADLAQGHNDVTAGNNPRAQQFPPHAVTAPAAGAPTSFPSDVFGDVNELGGANSAMSPRAYALSGRHLTSDPNPMGTFSRQSPSAMGHPGTPPALAAQSALLRQQLHAAASNGETSAASGHQQRPWSVADMATSLGLDHLYSHGDRKLQDNADAVYAGADRPHSDPNAAQLSAAQGMRGDPGGLSPHMYSQAQQAVAHLSGKDRPSQRVSMGGEEPSNSGAGGLSAQHLQQLRQSAQAAYGVSGAPHSTPIDPTQAGAAGNDPFLQLLQGLKVAKALQGGSGDPEEAQQQDSHYRALVQMLAHRNAQMPQQQQGRPAGSPSEAVGGMNGIVSAPAVPHHSTGAPDTVMGASSHSLSGAYDGRVHPGRPGSVAGLEDMHALASLVAHSAGMPSGPNGASQPGYLPGGLGGAAEGIGGGVLEGPAGLNGGGKPDQHQQATDMGIPNMMNTNVPMDASAAPHGFNGGSGSTWDVSDKQMQDIAPQFQEALSRLHASAPAVSQWPLSSAPHASNP